MARVSLFAFLISMAIVACDCEGESSDPDPCEPNPCQEANKTQCSPDEAGQAVCRCDSGTLDFGDGFCVSPWLSVPGGSFEMGSPEGVGIPAEHPSHRVTVAAFELYRAEVTVAQYRLCFQAGACSLPAEVSRCNYGVVERVDHPINCVNFQQAEQYCRWAGGRLPSEAEWEFAARASAGRSYPWGEQLPDCGLAVLEDPNAGGKGCGDNATAKICSKEAGHSELGFCDLGGNVYEWVADVFHDSYDNAPTDGSAWLEPAGDMRVRRGGSFDTVADTLRSAYRNVMMFNLPASSSGIRCAR